MKTGAGGVLTEDPFTSVLVTAACRPNNGLIPSIGKSEPRGRRATLNKKKKKNHTNVLVALGKRNKPYMY